MANLRKEIERRLSEKAPRDSWEITGWVDNPQAFLKELDLLVFTSRFEGFPLAIIEACCMGKRCLSVNFPGASEFLKLITFLEIISSFDPNTLGDSIIECMKKSNPVNEEVKRVRSYWLFLNR